MKNSLFIIALFGILSSCQQTQDVPAGTVAHVQKWMEESEIPGLAICVSCDGEIVWSEGFGFANIEHRVPVYPDKTRFRIGSISKSLTAMGLGILMDQGKIDLDDPVQTYVPYFPEKEYPVTTRQVAGHIAGIRHYKGIEYLSDKRYPSVREGLGIFMNDPLLFEPGTEYFYSSYGFNLLSAVIEGASGENFLDFMHEKVFSPLGMKFTVQDLTDSILSDRAAPYSMNHGNITNAPHVDNSYKWAGGGFLSTAEDLVKFGNAMLSDTILSKNTIKELVTSQKTSDGNNTGYGLGFLSDTIETGIIYFGHGGGSVGGMSRLAIYPEERVVMAIVTNDTEVRFDQRHKLAGMFMGK